LTYQQKLIKLFKNMKKIVLFLLLVVSSFTAYSQKTYSIDRQLQLENVAKGIKKDSVLVRGSDKIVRFIPRSEFGSSQNLDQTLGLGNTSKESIELVNLGGGKSVYSPFGTMIFSNTSFFPAASYLQDNIIYKNTTSGAVIAKFDFRGIGNFKLPSKIAGQDYTLVTLDDLKTPNLEQVLASGFSSKRTMYLSIDGTEKSTALGGDIVQVMDYDTGLGVTINPQGILIGQYPHYTRIVRNSYTRGMKSTLVMPEMLEGQEKTIATEELVSTKLTQNSDVVGYPRVYAARGNGTQTMYNVQTAPITTSAGNVNAVPNVQVVKDYVDSSVVRPYKSYVAMITQSGTANPNAVIMENTLGFVPVWSRVGAGHYRATFAGGFPSHKTYLNFQISRADPNFSWTSSMIAIASDEVMLALLKNGVNTDESGGLIEIRVYN
jgi:hypothetical protein